MKKTNDESIIARLWVPSLPMLLAAIATITACYAWHFELAPELIAAIITATAAIGTTVFIFGGSGLTASAGTHENGTHHAPKTRIARSAWLTAIIIVIISGYLAYRIDSAINTPCPLIASHGSNARVTDIVEYRYNRLLSLEILPDSTNASGNRQKPMFAAAFAPKDFPAGINDLIAIKAKCRPITAGDAKRSDRLRDFKRRGYSGLLYLDQNNTSPAMTAQSPVRERMRRLLARNNQQLFDRYTAGIITALYVGNTSTVEKSAMTSFKRAGVIHILSASGLHIGIISFIPLFLLGLLRVNRRTAYCLTMAALTLYLYITDMPVSLVRAFVMFAIFCGQMVFDLATNIINALFLSAVIILMLFPFELYNPGFQLSYGATLGILLLYRRYERLLSFLPGFLCRPLAVTLAAQFPVFPIILWHFNEINLSGIVTNITTVPLVNLALVLSILANAVSALSAIAGQAIGIATSLVMQANRALVDAIISVDGHFTAAYPPLLYLLPFLLLLAPLLPRINRHRAAAILIAVAYITVWCMHTGIAAPREQIAIITAPSRVIILKKENRAMLFGQLRSGDDVLKIINYFNRNGIRKISIHLPQVDFTNIRFFSQLVKRAETTDCTLSSDCSIRPYLRNFFMILEADGTSVTLSDLSSPEGLTNDRELLARASLAAGAEPLTLVKTLYFLTNSDTATIQRLIMKNATPERSIIFL